MYSKHNNQSIIIQHNYSCFQQVSQVIYYRLSSHELFFLIGEGQMTYVTDTTSGSFLQDKVSGTHHREQTLWVGCVCVGVCVWGGVWGGGGIVKVYGWLSPHVYHSWHNYYYIRTNVHACTLSIPSRVYTVQRPPHKYPYMRTFTTAASCMVIQLSGSFESWCRAQAVERWTSRSGDLR